jgi:hypothetical protein
MKALTLSSAQLRHFRFAQSGLLEPLADLQECAQRLVGLQAQIHPAAALAAAVRVPNLSHADLDSQLWHDKSLVKIWGQRGTLHIYAQSDWPLIHAVWSGGSWWKRRFIEEGLGTEKDYTRLLNKVESLAQKSPSLGRTELRALGVPERLLSSWGGLFADLVYQGKLCHLPRQGNEGRFAHRSQWLPELEWPLPAEATARREIVLRYLAGYGPASGQDLAHWAGWRVSRAETELKALQAELCAVQVEGQALWALKSQVPALNTWPKDSNADLPLLLLPRFDPMVLAHKNKDWLIDVERYKQVWQKAGHIEATVIESGRMAGTWRYAKRKQNLEVSVWPFAKLSRSSKVALEVRAQVLAQCFGLASAHCIYPD